MQTNLTTIILFTADVNRLVHFYEACFGLKVVGEPTPEWTVMNAGAVHLAFHRIGTAYRSETTAAFKAENNTKLVFETEKELSILQASLREKGIPAGEISHYPGAAYQFLEAQDPDGNIFQLMKYL